MSVGVTQVGAASWPSGHATRRRRARAVRGARGARSACDPRLRCSASAFALAVGAALLIRAWHMPSDVIGGYLLAALWMALAVAALRAAERRWPLGARAEIVCERPWRIAAAQARGCSGPRRARPAATVTRRSPSRPARRWRRG